MDFTVTVIGNNVLSDGTNRVAKLNNDSKRPKIVKFWNDNKPVIKETQSVSMPSDLNNDVLSKPTYDVILSNLGMNVVAYDNNSNIVGFRKLRVSNIVCQKARNVFQDILKENRMIEHTIAPMVSDISEPEGNGGATLNIHSAAKSSVNSMNNETRMSRLEKTGEMPNVSLGSIDYHNYDDKGMYSRVERKTGNDDYSFDIHNERVEVGKGEKDLNRIADLSPFNSSKVGTNDYQMAYDSYAASERRKKDSRERVLQLEREIRDVKAQLEEKHKRDIAELNAKTRANDEETLGYTMHSEDLRQQLKELREQLNSEIA